jgi:hypothetical protein
LVGATPRFKATSEKLRRTMMRQARLNQKKAMGKSARKRIQVIAVLISKAI